MTRLNTQRLELLALEPQAAAALPHDRVEAAATIRASLSPDWPADDLLDVLPMQAAASAEHAQYGIWVIVERATNTVIGDIGFLGPPGREHAVEIGYSVVPDRRRRGYAIEAAGALVQWALQQPGVDVVLARCDASNEPSIRTLERIGFSCTERHGEQLRWRLGRPSSHDAG
jgi:RimJ/RimL family protein N-acetyltransferase